MEIRHENDADRKRYGTKSPESGSALEDGTTMNLWSEVMLEAKKREQDVLQRYADGENMQQLAKRFSVSRQRIHQILKKWNCGRFDGGQFACTLLKEEERRARVYRKFGCSIEQLREYRDNGMTEAYRSQRNNAGTREIPWELSIGQYAAIWMLSGKWNYRGRHRGEYVMARFLDTGPYAWGNVEIVVSSDNIKLVRLRERMARRRNGEKR